MPEGVYAIGPDSQGKRIWARSVNYHEHGATRGQWAIPGAPNGDPHWGEFLLASRNLLRQRHIDTVVVNYTADWATNIGDADAHEYRLMTDDEARAENDRYHATRGQHR